MRQVSGCRTRHLALRLEILATGMPILGLPVFATVLMNVKAPRVRLNKTLPVLFGSQSNLLRATRALNRAPSLKAMPTSRSEPVSITSC